MVDIIICGSSGNTLYKVTSTQNFNYVIYQHRSNEIWIHCQDFVIINHIDSENKFSHQIKNTNRQSGILNIYYVGDKEILVTQNEIRYQNEVLNIPETIYESRLHQDIKLCSFYS
ncbi:hypothetical protein RF11_00049 [Thelohanellus kitauei]|uniref:Uncharacterized protein n=1 Tax=Thelohanellus kitauei TaxID=669202 RepID=A0A0C2JX67_THEKT|nr:hypothetical protein RF11_00049 [Thelohanellus kitauei]